jgi:hypothetical protein
LCSCWNEALKSEFHLKISDTKTVEIRTVLSFGAATMMDEDEANFEMIATRCTFLRVALPHPFALSSPSSAFQTAARDFYFPPSVLATFLSLPFHLMCKRKEDLSFSS